MRMNEIAKFFKNYLNMRRLRNPLVVCLSFVVVGIFALVTLNLSFLNPIEQVVKDFSMTDIYYQVLRDTGEPRESRAVTIVDMTELYSRSDLARVLDNIGEAGAKVIGVDVVFEGLKEDTLGDAMVLDVAKERKDVVFSYKLLNYVDDSLQYADAVHSFFTDSVTVTEGFTNMERNLYGGMKRSLSLGRRCRGELVSSFILQVANLYAEREVMPLEDKDLNINFSPMRFPVVDPDSIFENEGLVRDRIVLLGAMKDEYDMHYTPLGKMAGVELLAYSVQTLLQQKEVRKVSGFWLWVVSFVLVWLTQVMQGRYAAFVSRRRNRFARFYLGTTFVKGIITFLWMALLMGVAFVVFAKWDVSFNLGWAFSAIAFLEAARGFYDACAHSWNKE